VTPDRPLGGRGPGRRATAALFGSLLLIGVGLGACSGSDDESAFASAADTTSTTSSPTTTAGTTGDTATTGAGAAGGPVRSGSSGGGGASVPTAPDRFVVPDLVGRPVAEAEGLLSARGLRSLFVVVNDWRVARDVVASQDQPAGTVLGPDGVVSFRVSSGPTMAPVPNVAGQCVAVAQDRLLQAGFTSQVFYRVDAVVRYYRVISSSPAASVQQMQGSMVTLYVSTNVTRDGCG